MQISHQQSLRDTERLVDEGRAALLCEWLEVVDSLELALVTHPKDPVTQGLHAVWEQMEAVLARQHVTRIGAEGEQFDPERHEEVAVRYTDEVPDCSVVEVARSGYTLGDRVLRLAEVVVARPPVRD